MAERNVQIVGNRFKLAEGERNVWAVTIEQGTTREDIQNPAFLAHCAKKIIPWDHIEIRSDDGTVYAEYIVTEVGRAWVNLYCLRFENLTAADVSQTQAATLQDDDFTIKMRGPHLKWCVIRNSDSECIKEQCQKKTEAVEWLRGHIKAIEA